jgi:hypothetical protein
MVNSGGDMKYHDICSKITNQMIEMIEAEEILPWQKPWNGSVLPPTNIISGKAYRGWNNFFLGCANYSNPYFGTYNQIKKKNGKINKGEKGYPNRKIIFSHTLRYWDIIDSIFIIRYHEHYMDFIEQKLMKKLMKKLRSEFAITELIKGDETVEELDFKLPQNETAKTLIDKLKKKLMPFIEAFKADYKQEYEYTWFAENKSVYVKAWKEYMKKLDKERKRQKKEQKNPPIKSYRLTTPIILGRFETEIINAGFMTLRRMYHPDAGGKQKDFQKLEKAKNKLLGK